jgi:hypothetical protein
VYKAIAERDPACPTLLQALRSDKEIRSGINNTFAAIHECINRPDDLMKLLNSLPSMGAPVAIATSAASAPVTK